jgi:hypothetical protein
MARGCIGGVNYASNRLGLSERIRGFCDDHWNRLDQAADYARLTTMYAWYGAAMPFQGGEYGQVLGLESVAHHRVSVGRFQRIPGQ